MVETGISLSGGGSRGFAHIGVIKALKEAGKEPEIFAGTSMGAIMGALFANGYSVDEVTRIATDSKKIKLYQWNSTKMGITTHSSVRKILSDLLPETFEELKYPLYVSTTNLITTANVLFSKGPLIDPILASMSIPIVFNPVKIDGHLYVDGGLTKNLPAKILRDKCQILVGSHVNHITLKPVLKDLKAIAERCFRIAIHKTVEHDKDLCDFYVDPPELRRFETLDFKHVPEVIELGYQATIKELEKITGGP